MLTLRTGRPVRLEYTREEELTAARTRHPQIVTVKSGVKDGRLTALEMRVLENTGAYGTHALTVMSVTGNRALSLYRCPNLRYEARAVYTNLAVAGAFRGYGCPQGFFALESHVDEVAAGLGEDPAGAAPPEPRAGRRRPADRRGARRRQGGVQADHPLLRPAQGHRARGPGHRMDGEAARRYGDGRFDGSQTIDLASTDRTRASNGASGGERRARGSGPDPPRRGHGHRHAGFRDPGRGHGRGVAQR